MTTTRIPKNIKTERIREAYQQAYGPVEGDKKAEELITFIFGQESAPKPVKVKPEQLERALELLRDGRRGQGAQQAFAALVAFFQTHPRQNTAAIRWLAEQMGDTEVQAAVAPKPRRRAKVA